jgi:RNase H-fold protein (predicted Holliday junction resolvase)
MGVSRRKRGGHLDEIAAAVILQTYLDALRDRGEWEGEGEP